MADDTIERAALGRLASLGSLYDVRTDRFCGISMLRSNKLPDDAATFKPFTSCVLSVIKTDSMQVKFEKLSVKADLQLSVLGGLFKLDGSGKYLDEKKTSYRAVECTRVHNIVTGVEHLELFNDSVMGHISPEALTHESATHVVIDVYYGANCLLTFHDENRDNSSRVDIEATMETAFKRNPKVTSRGRGEAETQKSDTSSERQFSFRVFSDGLPATDYRSPTSCEDALALVDQMVNEARKATVGCGKPIKYMLFPLSAASFRARLASHNIPTTPIRVITKALNELAVNQFVALFDGIRCCVQQLNDFVCDMETYAECLSDADMKEAIKCRRRAAECETDMRVKLAKALPGLRSGGEDTTRQFENLHKKCEKLQEEALSERSKGEDVYQRVVSKISFAQFCKKYGVKYVKYAEEARRLWLDNDEVYVLYASTKLRKDKPDVWERNEKAFILRAKDSQKQSTVGDGGVSKQNVLPSIFVFVDGDFAVESVKSKGIRIEKYCKSECVRVDVTASKSASLGGTGTLHAGLNFYESLTEI